MTDQHKGRILRLKQGYNPNSSSIGTIVFAMPAALMAATVGFGAAAAFICGAFARGRGQQVGGPIEADRGEAPATVQDADDLDAGEQHR